MCGFSLALGRLSVSLALDIRMDYLQNMADSERISPMEHAGIR
jgi:hypothetical protein